MRRRRNGTVPFLNSYVVFSNGSGCGFWHAAGHAIVNGVREKLGNFRQGFAVPKRNGSFTSFLVADQAIV